MFISASRLRLYLQVLRAIYIQLRQGVILCIIGCSGNCSSGCLCSCGCGCSCCSYIWSIRCNINTKFRCFLRYYRLDRAGSAAYSKADGRERYEKSNSHVHAVRGNVYDNSRYFISRVYGCRSSVIGGNGIFRYNRFYCIVICKEGFDS